MRYFEQYACGCVSKQSSKRELLGYCSAHGKDRIGVFRSDGKPLTASKLCKKCKRRPARAAHVCPFQADVHEDNKTLCNCCEECTTECADNV